MNRHLLLVSGLFFCVAGALQPSAQGQELGKCEGAFGGTANPPVAEVAQVPREVTVRSLEDLVRALSNGTELDPKSPDHQRILHLYLRGGFGDPRTDIGKGDPVARVFELLRQYPKLRKTVLRSYHLRIGKAKVPVPASLKTLVASLVKNSGQTNANLLNPVAQSGYWARLLNCTAAEVSSKLPPELSAQLLNPKTLAQAKATAVYRFLQQLKEATPKEDEATLRRLSQAQVDVVHAVPVTDIEIRTALKDGNADIVLGAVRKWLGARDKFAEALGFEDHFKGLLDGLKIAQPTGVNSEAALQKSLSTIEAEIGESAATLTTGSSEDFVIRQLSTLESPFRSFLGDTDCSTRTYLATALNPNYHYYTMTDPEGRSSGHITVVFGTGTHNGKKVPMAFVDKVQNVPTSRLLVFFEGVRRSLSDAGYKLVLPSELGDTHTGISNFQDIREFIAGQIPVSPEQEWVSDFRQHPLEEAYPLGEPRFSRVNDGGVVRPVAEVALPPGVELVPGVLRDARVLGPVDIEGVIAATIALKNGNDEEKFRYILGMRQAKAMGLTGDSAFNETFEEWKKTGSYSLRRRMALLDFSKSKPSNVRVLEEWFSAPEWRQFLDSFFSTPQNRAMIAGNEDSIRDLLMPFAWDATLPKNIARTFPLANLVKEVMKIPGFGATVGDRNFLKALLVSEDFRDSRKMTELMRYAFRTSSVKIICELMVKMRFDRMDPERELFLDFEGGAGIRGLIPYAENVLTAQGRGRNDLYLSRLGAYVVEALASRDLQPGTVPSEDQIQAALNLLSEKARSEYGLLKADLAEAADDATRNPSLDEWNAPDGSPTPVVSNLVALIGTKDATVIENVARILEEKWRGMGALLQYAWQLEARPETEAAEAPPALNVPFIQFPTKSMIAQNQKGSVRPEPCRKCGKVHGNEAISSSAPARPIRPRIQVTVTEPEWCRNCGRVHGRTVQKVQSVDLVLPEGDYEFQSYPMASSSLVALARSLLVLFPNPPGDFRVKDDSMQHYEANWLLGLLNSGQNDFTYSFPAEAEWATAVAASTVPDSRTGERRRIDDLDVEFSTDPEWIGRQSPEGRAVNGFGAVDYETGSAPVAKRVDAPEGQAPWTIRLVRRRR